jgi:phage anti-repressor protein
MIKLIRIRQTQDNTQTVSARELYDYLEVNTHFTDWCKRMFEYGFDEGIDFTSILGKSTGGRPSVDYALTMDTAKEISMLQRTDKGKAVRKYFIACEAQLRDLQLKNLLENQIASTKLLAASAQLSEYDHLNFIGEYDEIDSTVHIKRFVQLYINEWTRAGFVPNDLINKQYKLYCKTRGIAKPYNFYRMSLTILNYCPKIMVKCELDKTVGYKGIHFYLLQQLMR